MICLLLIKEAKLGDCEERTKKKGYFLAYIL